jgi:hypothetical protein
VDTVNVALAELPFGIVTVVKLRDIVGPLLTSGEMVAPRLTLPVKLLMLARVMVVALEEMSGRLKLPGLAEIPKPTRRKYTLAVTIMEPLVPVTVTV